MINHFSVHKGHSSLGDSNNVISAKKEGLLSTEKNPSSAISFSNRVGLERVDFERLDLHVVSAKIHTFNL